VSAVLFLVASRRQAKETSPEVAAVGHNSESRRYAQQVVAEKLGVHVSPPTKQNVTLGWSTFCRSSRYNRDGWSSGVSLVGAIEASQELRSFRWSSKTKGESTRDKSKARTRHLNRGEEVVAIVT